MHAGKYCFSQKLVTGELSTAHGYPCASPTKRDNTPFKKTDGSGAAVAEVPAGRSGRDGGTQGDVRTSSLEMRPGGSRVGETGGQWPLPSSPSAESGTLVIRCGRRLEWKGAGTRSGGRPFQGPSPLPFATQDDARTGSPRSHSLLTDDGSGH